VRSYNEERRRAAAPRRGPEAIVIILAILTAAIAGTAVYLFRSGKIVITPQDYSAADDPRPALMKTAITRCIQRSMSYQIMSPGVITKLAMEVDKFYTDDDFPRRMFTTPEGRLVLDGLIVEANGELNSNCLSVPGLAPCQAVNTPCQVDLLKVKFRRRSKPITPLVTSILAQTTDKEIEQMRTDRSRRDWWMPPIDWWGDGKPMKK